MNLSSLRQSLWRCRSGFVRTMMRLGVAMVLACVVAGSAFAADALRQPSRLGGGPNPPAPPPHDHIGTISQPLSGTQGTIWPSNSIAVCWENPTAADQASRTAVQQQIAATWEANSLVRFTGWGTCGANDKGIRIQTGDFHPHTEGVGTQLDGKHGGMKLNFTWTGCGGNAIGCVRWVAAHEFGHALGFDHEQNRPDAPPWCAEQAQGPTPDIYMTPFDAQSIMNYCNTQWNNNGNLSASDIAGVQFWYGPSQSSGNPWLPDCRVNAVLYTDNNFAGKSLMISGTMDELAEAGFNDRASSLCVPAGMILKAYTDWGFSGTAVTFRGPTLVRALPGQNDKFSSVQLIDARTNDVLFDAPPNCASQAVVFEDSFFRKGRIVVGSSLPDLTKVNFNDKISSVCVPAGHSVTLFQDINFKGQSVTFAGPAFRTNLKTMGWNDSVSSIKFN